jgi:uridine kinase
MNEHLSATIVGNPALTRSIVTIDGVDGSGKSTFARRLQAILGARAVLFSVDDFRRPVDWSRTDRSELDLYYKQRYDLGALDGCVRAFVEGHPGCRVQIFDGNREILTGVGEMTFGAAEVALVEGVFVARLRCAADAFSIFVDVPREEAAARVRKRDLSKGRTEEEVERRTMRRYFPAHDRYLSELQARERAAVLIENRDGQRPRMVRARLPDGAGWAPVRRALEDLLAEPATASPAP